MTHKGRMHEGRALNLQAFAKRTRRNARGATLATFDGLPLKISRFSSHPRWEMHPAGDEVLQVIEGALELVLLQNATPLRVRLTVGELLVVPRGIWHSPMPVGEVTLLHMANYSDTRISHEDLPA